MTRGPDRDAGSVTAETAVVLPSLLVVLAGCLAAITAVSAELHCTDAAGLAARAAARGDSDAAVFAAVRATAPDAVVTVRRGDGLVRVQVTLQVGLLPGAPVDPLRVNATAVAPDETALPETALPETALPEVATPEVASPKAGRAP